MLLGNFRIVNIDAIDKEPLLLLYFQVITTHHPLAILALGVECPILQTVAALPFHPIRRVLILVPKLNRDLVLCKGEKFLSEAVGFLFIPFLDQEVDNALTPGEKGGAIAPDGICGVRQGAFFGVAR